MRHCHGAGIRACIGVEQGAVARGREQAAIVVLAVDFDQIPPNLAQQRRRTGLVIEEGTAAAIRLQRPADQQRLAGFQRDIVLRQQRGERRPFGRGRETRGHLRLVRALPHQRAVGAHPEREAQRVEQDRLARAGLARQHAQTGLEIEIEPFDQNDIGD